MKIDLIKGLYATNDAISIITKMIDVKIKFQEEKIKNSDYEEDIKMRENRIKSLQNDLFESRKLMKMSGDTITLESAINLK